MSAPTGSPAPYGPSGPYVQPGYPPNVPPQTPQPPAPYAPPRSNRPLIVVAVLLGLAVILTGSFVLGRITAPTAPAAVSTPTTTSASANATTSASTTGTGFTLTGSTLSGPGFTAKMPSGWTLAAENGVDTNDGVIQNGSKNTLAYFASDPSPATSRCHYAAESYRAELGGAVVDLPAVPWGKGTAIVKELETKYASGQAIGLDIYCVDRPGNTSAVILSIAAPEHQETNKAAAEGLLASWVWT